jgi:hypothetical protein
LHTSIAADRIDATVNATSEPDLGAATLSRSVARGVGWIETQMRADGSFRGSEHDLAGYYKSLLALAVCGRLEPAARCRAFLSANLREPNGELAHKGVKTSIARMSGNLANYMDGWVAIGAWLLEDFELADEIVELLILAQSDEHGGVLTGPERWAGRPRYDLATAASCGRAFLVCGRRDAAQAAGEFLVEALRHQVSPDQRLDLVFDSRWQALAPSEEGERTYYRFEHARRGEKVWFCAFSCAFLCELHALTKDARHLAAAQEYYGFVERTPEFRDGSIANGKSGWSAGLLASATGKPHYRETLDLIAANVLGRQALDGEFTAAGVPRGGESAHDSIVEMPRRLERTAEFTVWVAEFLRMSAAHAVQAKADRNQSSDGA